MTMFSMKPKFDLAEFLNEANSRVASKSNLSKSKPRSAKRANEAINGAADSAGPIASGETDKT